ncbi:c-type cytochrome [Planctomycetaceae bacterium SH139]
MLRLLRHPFVFCLIVTSLFACRQQASAQPAEEKPSLREKLLSESPQVLSDDVLAQGSSVRGAILYTQPNISCSRCHGGADQKLLGPNLSGLGDQVTIAHLVESLLEPSKQIREGFAVVNVLTTTGQIVTGKIIRETASQLELRSSGDDLAIIRLDRQEVEEVVPSQISAMPENLVDQLRDRQQFLDLVRYVYELSRLPGSSSPQPTAGDNTGKNNGRIAGQATAAPAKHQGLALLQALNCVACHAASEHHLLVSAKQPPKLSWSAAHLQPAWLEQFIANPQQVKPGTTMPAMLANLPAEERRQTAAEITLYLRSLAKPAASDAAVAMPAESRDEPASPARGETLFHSVGCVACHSPRDDTGGETLATSSVPLGELAEKYSLAALTAFLRDPLAVRPSGRMPHLQLTHWEAIDIASYLLSSGRPAEQDLNNQDPIEQSQIESAEFDQQLVARGREHFLRQGCAACHLDIVSEAATDTAAIGMTLAQLDLAQGCLSGVSGEWPAFNLDEEQRTLLRTGLQASGLQEVGEALSRDDQLTVSLLAFRCLHCHQRDGLGGVSDERNPHFKTTNPNLGPQGRIPPTLSNVGAKLQPRWLRQVLGSGRPIRPYLLTRMPQFGSENVGHLAELFEQVDQLSETKFAEVNDAKDANDAKELREAGFQIVGSDGLNCVACHTFQLKEALNMPAVDLTEMAERLQKRWFYHYMRDPQSLSPNTVMPSFWPANQAMRKDILEGDVDRQIEATWQYLLEGRQARQPRGVVIEPMALLATDEAVMLRRSYPGIGKRGIGVGYPHRVNLAFDAEQMRLGMIWQGDFVDPGGVWRSQGHGQVRPLGKPLHRFAAGPDFDSRTRPWVVDEDRPPRHQFKGYQLDSQQRPRFRYRFDGIDVEDYFVDQLADAKDTPLLHRSVTLQSPEPRDDLRFRAASGQTIEPLESGGFQIDNGLIVRIDSDHEARIVDVEDGKQLIVPLTIATAATVLKLTYTW